MTLKFKRIIFLVGLDDDRVCDVALHSGVEIFEKFKSLEKGFEELWQRFSFLMTGSQKWFKMAGQRRRVVQA